MIIQFSKIPKEKKRNILVENKRRNPSLISNGKKSYIMKVNISKILFTLLFIGICTFGKTECYSLSYQCPGETYYEFFCVNAGGDESEPACNCGVIKRCSDYDEV